MGCHVSSNVSRPVLQRMDTETMLSLQKNYHSTATVIWQEEEVDHLSCAPLSPFSIRKFFPTASRPVSPLSSIGGFYEDDLFTADTSSLFPARVEQTWQDVIWLRPHEMCAKPKLFVDGVSRCDVKQGILGDCWLLSACAAVATKQELLERVVSPSQPLSGQEYTGLLVFNFWRFGEWIQVCIDDRLPTRNSKLIFASCTHHEEFWLPLLEKAFAKIHGSYAALEGGHAGSALADLTGGIAERIAVEKCTYQQLEGIFQQGAFVTCSGDKAVEGSGLVQGHAYTITAFREIGLSKGGFVYLLRLRSPWADSVEWRGAWSDGSPVWETAREEDRNYRVACDDGEFWMDFADFKERFQELTLATLGPDFDQDGAADVHRQQEVIRGSWNAESAGGSRNNLESFQNNPQYLLRLEGSPQNALSSVLMGLMQLPRSNAKLLPIALFVYKTDNATERLQAEDFLCTADVSNSGPFADTWEVLIRCLLPAGNYIIIPATFLPDCSAEFLMRIFAVAPFSIQNLGSA